MTLGPATIKHSPDTYATPWKWNNGGTEYDYSSPAGGSYNSGDGTYQWAHTLPGGGHTYAFNGTVTLPNASPVPFNGYIKQLVKGYAVVMFEPQGGTMHSNDTVSLNAAGPVAEPSPAPTYEGNRLVGWYTQPTGGNRWDFSQNVTGSMTLYARWSPAFTLPKAGAIPLQQ
ncbi:hypothetical protein KIMH_01160 [Bombiscardovia apis]|uniref:Uncharacterized protein n=2 Tax=Bombiscardovia apis TaxID=2932182 RepID=A0ABM8BBN4_9BIFI|nr:hypothetical protein KIMH_01160 [Bombiscardovia apis]